MSEHIYEDSDMEHERYHVIPFGSMREEIVRCRDCACAVVTHPRNPITGAPAGIEVWRCDYFWNADELCEVEPDGFCAWGEKKVDE